MKNLLLHICCGPCATGVINALSNSYSVTGYFYNPNVWPLREYIKRLESAKKVGESMDIEIIPGPYEDAIFELQVKDLADEKEGGKRCLICYRLRLEKTAIFAREKGMDIFATTLSISPHKNANAINSIGREVAQEYGINFYEGDFKKNNGFTKSLKLSKQLGLYRQKYCGCRYSEKSARRTGQTQMPGQMKFE